MLAGDDPLHMKNTPSNLKRFPNGVGFGALGWATAGSRVWIMSPRVANIRVLKDRLNICRLRPSPRTNAHRRFRERLPATLEK